MNRRRAVLVPALLLLLGLFAGGNPVAAQPGSQSAGKWPERPVTIVVPFAAGGATDSLARILAQRLTESLGQSVIVDNKPGAGGTIAAASVARAEPGGYTFLLISSTHAINETLVRNHGYELLRDLQPVVEFSETPFWLLTPLEGAKSVPALIATARTRPVNYASGGPGSLAHLLGELLRQKTGADLVHIPYKGNGPALTDVMANRIDMIFDNGSAGIQMATGGKLNAIAVTTEQRLTTLPNVATMTELGFPDLTISGWIGLAAPAGTPASVIARMDEEVKKAIAEPAIEKQIRGTGSEVVYRSAEKFGALWRQEVPKWAEVIGKAGIKFE
jgi:tripartite-type tricarboxylate transporter receptor subunit TctC